MTLETHNSIDVVALLRRAERAYPDRVAFQWESGSCTFSELMLRVDRVAAALAAVGVRPGDRVAFILRNGPTFLEIYLASLHLGAICVPLNYRLRAGEIAFQLADAEPSFLLVDESTAEEAAKVDLPENCRLYIDGPARGAESFGRLISGAPTHTPSPVLNIFSPASLLYTSGTTGKPKGVVRSRLALAYLVPLRAAAMGFGPDSSIL